MKISQECPEEYTLNPDNEYIKIRYKNLTKGSYTVEGGYEEGYEWETGGYQSSSGQFHTEGVSEDNTSFRGKNEAVQLFPQEIHLKLRISEFFCIHFCILVVIFI